MVAEDFGYVVVVGIVVLALGFGYFVGWLIFQVVCEREKQRKKKKHKVEFGSLKHYK